MIDNKKLLTMAKEVMKNSYAPYSNFSVGSAIQMKSGKIYTGCNVENASYGATNCAERTAIFKAISEGEKEEIVAIAIVSSGKIVTYPCGVCRQVISEFMGKNGVLIFEDENGNEVTHTFGEMFPYGFTKDELDKGLGI